MPHLALRLRFVLIVVVLTCHGVGQRAVRAQGSTEGVRAFEHAHATQAARNPVGLSLHIRTESGSTDFGIGEPITLVLEFSDQDGARQDGAGEDGARYDFDSRTYDRSGRLEIDRIRVAPAERVEDPLHDYYHAMGLGFAGGGLSRVPAPLTSPRVLSLDVNEFIRFTRPGTYRVYVESHRFLDRQAPTPRSRPLPLVSNILELTIAAQRTDASPPSVLPARAAPCRHGGGRRRARAPAARVERKFVPRRH
jgi:hypothetical protein